MNAQLRNYLDDRAHARAAPQSRIGSEATGRMRVGGSGPVDEKRWSRTSNGGSESCRPSPSGAAAGRAASGRRVPREPNPALAGRDAEGARHQRLPPDLRTRQRADARLAPAERRAGDRPPQDADGMLP